MQVVQERTAHVYVDNQSTYSYSELLRVFYNSLHGSYRHIEHKHWSKCVLNRRCKQCVEETIEGSMFPSEDSCLLRCLAV